MVPLSNDDLRRLAREVFGRELTPEQAEAYRSRLPVMARNVEILNERAGQLGRGEPAAVHATPRPERGAA